MAGSIQLRVVLLDVYPTQLGHCPHYNLVSSQMMAAGSEFCELSSQALEYPQEVIESHRRALAVLNVLRRALDGKEVNVEVEMVDALSPKGFLLSLRYGVRGNFAVVVNGKKVYDGEPSVEAVERALEDYVSEALNLRRVS
ncbi:MAG: hypothetical protein NZ953_04055 [Thaumarchaeota archaeon]|nr:hypothetical protein [Candidatus Calditenuaceae archaeon]MCX8202915.1 hypothetical protein [Nitrososphaeria archaeon]MDW8043594.1 hypothetical protein [Nitrososphaerota archaeon]